MQKLTLTTALCATLATGAFAQNATEMRCSHQLPPQHAVAGVIDRWAERVETLSNGDIDVQIFGANALATAKENIPAVAQGTIECAFSVNFQWGRTLPAMNVTLRPFSFSDYDLWRNWPGSKPAAFLEAALEQKGLKNVVWLFQTNDSVFTSNGKFLKSPADFDGMKIRGLNRSFDSALVAMGAAPSSMSGSEVYQALSTGVIDAALTDVATAHSRKYYEVQDHMVQVPVISVFFNGYVNPDFHANLSQTSKDALDQAGREAAVWAVDAAIEATTAAHAKLQAEGVELHVATDAENEALRAIMQPAFDAEFTQEAGADVQTLIDLIDQM